MSSLGKNVILVFKIDAYTRRKCPIQLVRAFHRMWRLFFSPSVPPTIANRPSTQLDPLTSPEKAEWHLNSGESVLTKNTNTAHTWLICVERVSCRIYRFGYVSINPNFLSMEKTESHTVWIIR